VKRVLVSSILSLGLVLASAPGILAETTYEDDDSSYLRVISFVVEPVGQLLEWIVFRPIHAVHHAISPAETIDGRPLRRCTSLRPGRDCRRR
jgi:hypothetical protein